MKRQSALDLMRLLTGKGDEELMGLGVEDVLALKEKSIRESS